MSEDNIKKKSHRDFTRCNDANSAVKGCIYADINNACIKALLNDTETNDVDNKLTQSEVINLLQIAKDANQKSKNLLVGAQKAIGRRVCKTYASQQVTQLQLIHKNKEVVDNVKSISNFIVQDKMIQMTKQVFCRNQSGT